MALHATNVWDSIDKLAEREGVSLPALALQAGLDQSTFSHARRQRNWMSLKTLARVLNRYQVSIVEWARMVDEKQPDPDPPDDIRNISHRPLSDFS